MQGIYRDLIRYLRVLEPESRTSLKFSAASGHRVAFDPGIRASAAFSRNGRETETSRAVCRSSDFRE